MPYERYRRDLQQEGFQHDPAQERAVQRLQKIYDQLLAQPTAPAPAKKTGLFARWSGRDKAETTAAAAVRGLYLWGGVGRGKTYLVDTFVDALPLDRKLRIHFHSFMRMVHAELKELKNQPDPLKVVARRFAKKARVICLDEFFVADITDAMLLDGLLRELFASGVTLITTSNIEPDGLYTVSYTHLDVYKRQVQGRLATRPLSARHRAAQAACRRAERGWRGRLPAARSGKGRNLSFAAG